MTKSAPSTQGRGKRDVIWVDPGGGRRRSTLASRRSGAAAKEDVGGPSRVASLGRVVVPVGFASPDQVEKAGYRHRARVLKVGAGGGVQLVKLCLAGQSHLQHERAHTAHQVSQDRPPGV